MLLVLPLCSHAAVSHRGVQPEVVMRDLSQRRATRAPMSICVLLSLAVAGCATPEVGGASSELVSSGSGLRALYLTDHSAYWHDYEAQADRFGAELTERVNVDLVVVGKSQQDTVRTLSTPDFAVGYDLVIYNMCLPDVADPFLLENVIRQTEELGVPAVFVHCAIHSFRWSSEEPGWADRSRRSRAQRAWRAARPDEPLPRWSRFTGVDSVSHDWARAMTAEQTDVDHAITRSLPMEFRTPRDELFRNLGVQDDVTPLYTSHSPESRRDHVVAWVREAGAARVFGTTLGHDQRTQSLDVYFDLLANGVLWVTHNLDETGAPRAGFAGTTTFENYQGTVRCRPGSVEEPTSVAEVQAAVLRAGREGRPVKVVSLPASNSNTEIICPDPGGLLLNVHRMNRVLSIDRRAMTVTVEPGVRLADLSAALHAEGLAIPNMPDYTGVSVAGSMATGAHHSSLRTPASVADMAVAMRIVDGRGNVQTFEGDDIDATAVHLGLLGAVVELTLRVEPQFKLQYGHTSGNDRGLEDRITALVRSHDYARVMWFAGNERYVLDHYDRVLLSTPGDSQHNLWNSTAGIFRVVGDTPYAIINNLPLRAQCDSALLRSQFWQSPIDARGSSASAPVGYSHEMLASSCPTGRCPWDVPNVRSRTMEAAFPLQDLAAWMRDVRAILERNRGCFPVLGIYLRFSLGSDRWMAFNEGGETVAFEIHVPMVADEDRLERSSAVYDEIMQMTLRDYNGRPHWGKNATSDFLDLDADQYPRVHDFMRLRDRMDPDELFLNPFFRSVLSHTAPAPYAGCVLARDCTCETDLHCGTGASCEPGGFFTDARVCR